MIYQSGEEVEFECKRPCIMDGKRYVPGDRIRVKLAVPWNIEDGMGFDGPWGSGGYSTWFLKSLGEIL